MNLFLCFTIIDNSFQCFRSNSFVPVLRKDPKTNLCFLMSLIMFVIGNNTNFFLRDLINYFPWAAIIFLVTFLVPLHLFFCFFKCFIPHPEKRDHLRMAQSFKYELLISR